MNREEIVALAEKAGFERLFPGIEDWVCFTEEIERFYKMVVAADREAFAKESAGTEQPAQQQGLTPYMIHANGAIQRITPSKQWVGLTTDEMIQVKDRFKLSGVNIAVAFRTIEAKLREKNS